MEEGAEEEEETTDEDEDEVRRDEGSPPMLDMPTPLPINAGGWP